MKSSPHHYEHYSPKVPKVLSYRPIRSDANDQKCVQSSKVASVVNRVISVTRISYIFNLQITNS